VNLILVFLRSHPDIDVIEEKPILNSLENIIKSQFNYKLEEIYKLNLEEVNILKKNYLVQIKKLSDKKMLVYLLINSLFKLFVYH
jgi:hypothetical protein